MICLNCKKKLENGMGFCPYCGTKVSVTNEPKVKYCPQCHAERPGNMAFCSVCGSKLDETETFGGTTEPNPFEACPILQDDPLELFEWEQIPGGDRKITKYKNTYATEIIIPEGENVVVIGAGAFKCLQYLEKITIPGSVKIIEDEAFADCPELEIELPKGIHIGKDVISGTKTAKQRAKLETERKAREEAERKAREEAERKAREEAERKAREEAERKAKEERYKIGKMIEFGSYPQDENGTREAIQWRILDRKDNKILIISEKALDCQKYNTSFADVTWETCSLRKWLNGSFLNNAFNTKEQGIIQSTTVSADKNPEYNTNPGNATIDKIFLLSITEVKKYFTSDEDGKCVPTAYAIAKGAWTSDKYTKGGKATCYWWLRSPGYYQGDAAYVSSGGSVDYSGFNVDIDNGCVRPALWINLDS